MKKCFFFFFSTVLFCVLAWSAMAADKITQDMADFDSFYAAALFFTSNENRTSSKKAMKQLDAQWAAFKKILSRNFPHDRPSRSDLAIINQMIEDAVRNTRLNARPSEVYEILKGVRISFFHLRKRNSIDYYLDYLTKFYLSMEPIFITAIYKKPETFTNETIQVMTTRLSEAAKDWHQATMAHFDQRLFSFSAAREESRKELVNKVTESISRLKTALDAQDRLVILQEIASVESNFNKLYFLFGDTQISD